jgi:hypothetical protein
VVLAVVNVFVVAAVVVVVTIGEKIARVVVVDTGLGAVVLVVAATGAFRTGDVGDVPLCGRVVVVVG